MTFLTLAAKSPKIISLLIDHANGSSYTLAKPPKGDKSINSCGLACSNPISPHKSVGFFQSSRRQESSYLVRNEATYVLRILL